MENADKQQSSGKKHSGESVELPKQNTRKNLNDTSPRKDGKRFGYGGDTGSMAEKGYSKESM